MNNEPIEILTPKRSSDDTDAADVVMQTEVPDQGPALVFGASGPQGRAVIEGLQEHGYGPLYGATRDVHSPDARYAQDVLDVTLLQVDMADVRALEKVLAETQATSIFLVTTTDMPTGNGDRADYGFQSAEDSECDTIKSFFDTLVKVYNLDHRTMSNASVPRAVATAVIRGLNLWKMEASVPTSLERAERESMP